MTFADSEKSLTESEPYELHEFRLGESSTYWCYADAPADVSYGGHTFTKCYISGGKIEQGANVIKSMTIVKCDWLNPFAWQYTVCPPDSIIHYTRYKGHYTDVETVYIGDVVDFVFNQDDRKGNRWAEIIIDPSTAAMQVTGLATRYSRPCQVELYSDLCGVDRDDYNEIGTLDGVSGNVLESTVFGGEPPYEDGYWSGGDIIVNSRRRKIVNHTGNYITIQPGIQGLAAGQSFDAAPGCGHLPAICDVKFGHLDDYKGQPNIPDDNPWSPYGVQG